MNRLSNCVAVLVSNSAQALPPDPFPGRLAIGPDGKNGHPAGAGGASTSCRVSYPLSTLYVWIGRPDSSFGPLSC
jgi:hypothetical protein